MVEVRFQRPSLARYHGLFFQSDLSILRLLEYEHLARLGLTGTVLDFGGGEKINYAKEIGRWAETGASFTYQSANIDAATRPTFLLETGKPLPVADETFDAVLSLNTLEHVYELDLALAEFYRILKTDGRLILSVPFMFRVHGHPDDYFRGTANFWQRKLRQVGFGELTVEALQWGPFSTAHMVSGLPGPFKVVRRHIGLLLDVVYFVFRFKGKTVISGKQDAPFLAAPIGYLLEAKKTSVTAH